MRQSLEFDLHVVVEVGMAADMEIAWYFLDCIGSDESATVLVSKGLSNHFKLFHWILFSQQLKRSLIKVISIFI